MTDAARIRLAQDIADQLLDATVEAQVSACRQRIIAAGAGLVHELVSVPDAPSPVRLGALVSATRQRLAGPARAREPMPRPHQSRYPRRSR